MKKAIVVFMSAIFAILSVSAYAEGNQTWQRAYISTSGYIHNDETDRNIYVVETKPSDLADGEKVPLLIFVHGNDGSATSLQNIYRKLAPFHIAAYSFECCGGNNGVAKSDGAELYPTHYSSRISDLEAVLQAVKELEYVDQNQVYILGESYGTIVSALDAAMNPTLFSGLIIVSSAFSEHVVLTNEGNSFFEKYAHAEDAYEYILGYHGNVLIISGDQDEMAMSASRKLTEIYQNRNQGNVVFHVLANSGHGFAMFSADGKTECLELIRSFILD